MSRALLILANDGLRAKAKGWIDAAKPGSRVEFKGPRRSNDQNSLLWAMLTAVATQVKWHGVRLAPGDWKLLFLDALGSDIRAVPNLYGNGYVSLGRSSSDLSKAEMSDMIALMEAWGADPAHLVQWVEERVA